MLINFVHGRPRVILLLQMLFGFHFNWSSKYSHCEPFDCTKVVVAINSKNQGQTFMPWTTIINNNSYNSELSLSNYCIFFLNQTLINKLCWIFSIQIAEEHEKDATSPSSILPETNTLNSQPTPITVEKGGCKSPCPPSSPLSSHQQNRAPSSDEAMEVFFKFLFYFELYSKF